MADADAGGRQGFRCSCGDRWLEDGDGDSGGGGEFGWGDGARTVEDHGAFGGVEDGGFEAEGGGAGVEYGVDAAGQVGEDVGGGGGAGVAEGIGTGSGDGESSGLQQSLSGRVRGDADTDQFPAGGDSVGDGGVAGEQKCERARPEGGGERGDAGCEFGWNLRDGVELRCVSEMDDERVPRGALLGGEDASDRGGRECVGSEAVDGFRGEGDEFALLEELCGTLDVGAEVGVEMEGLGHRAVTMVSPSEVAGF